MTAMIWGVTTYLLVVALFGYSLFMLTLGLAAWISGKGGHCL